MQNDIIPGLDASYNKITGQWEADRQWMQEKMKRDDAKTKQKKSSRK